MAKLPQISGKNLSKALKKDGWQEVGQKGSHRKLVKYTKPTGKTTVIIPQHKVLKKGTLTSILKAANISVENLKKLI